VTDALLPMGFPYVAYNIVGLGRGLRSASSSVSALDTLKSQRYHRRRLS
jgi:hypothetical protein